MIAALLMIPLQGEPPAPRLLLGDLEGKETELALDALPMRDPRERGAWIVRMLDFPAGATPRESETARLTLANGDEIFGGIRGGAGERLDLELVGGVVLPFELAALRSIELPAHVPDGARQTLQAPQEGDRLYRRTSGALDAIDGTVEGFETTGVRFDSVLGARTIPWDEVAAIFVEVLSSAPAPAEATRVPVSLELAGADGGRLRGGLVALERESCRLILGGRTEVALPIASVAELAVADGRLTYLSDLVPSGETGRGAPFGDELGMTWPHRMDRSVLGMPLRAGGSVHRRGIGQHSPSTLTFALDGSYRTLRGRVAIDDSSLQNGPRARGSVVFRVRLDGAVAWESALIRGGDAPVAVPPVNLAGKRELSLEVDPAGDFVGDRADWLAPVLIR